MPDWILVLLGILIGLALIWGSVRWAMTAEERPGRSRLPDAFDQGDDWLGQTGGDCGPAHHGGNCGGHDGGH